MGISVREYLTTSYRPDCDYVDGELQGRLWGETDHSALQGALAAYYHERRKQWGIHVYLSLRMQLAPTRFRVADICVYAGREPDEQIPRTAPLLCIEIISPEDRFGRLMEKKNDYLRFGVQYVWFLYPDLREAQRAVPGGLLNVSELRTENPDTVVPLEALFE